MLLLMLLAALTAPLAPETGDWVRLAGNSTGGAFGDTRPGPPHEGFPTMRWAIVITPSHRRYAAGVRYQRQVTAYDCAGRRLRTLEITNYNSAGARLAGGQTIPGAWGPVSVSSWAYHGLQYFCGGASERAPYRAVGVMTYPQLAQRFGPAPATVAAAPPAPAAPVQSTPPISPTALASLTRALECRTPVENIARELSGVPFGTIKNDRGWIVVPFNAKPTPFGLSNLRRPLALRIIEGSTSSAPLTVLRMPDKLVFSIKADFRTVESKAISAWGRPCVRQTWYDEEDDVEYEVKSCLMKIRNSSGSVIRTLEIDQTISGEYTFVTCWFKDLT